MGTRRQDGAPYLTEHADGVPFGVPTLPKDGARWTCESTFSQARNWQDETLTIYTSKCPWSGYLQVVVSVKKKKKKDSLLSSSFSSSVCKASCISSGWTHARYQQPLHSNGLNKADSFHCVTGAGRGQSAAGRGLSGPPVFLHHHPGTCPP